MKAKITHIGLVSFLFSLSGCGEEEFYSGFEPSLSAHWLSVSETSFEHYSSYAFAVTFDVQSLGTPWKFSDVAEWIALSPLSGEASMTVTMNVKENESADNARTAIFYLQSDAADWNFSRAISVSQDKANPVLSTDETALSFGGASGQKSIKVSANCEWSASCSESWVSLNEDLVSGILNVSVSANPLDTYREGNIYLRYGDTESARIELTQSPSAISASAYTLQYENTASKYDVTIESEAEWTAVVSDSWIQVTPDKGGAGQTSVTIEVAPNISSSDRSGYVSIMTGSTDRLEIAIRQRGMYIEADASLEFKSTVESKKLRISSNTDWEVLSWPDWLTLSDTTGTGNGEITVTSAENPSTSPREGEIVIGKEGLDMRFTVTVTQSGKTLTTETTSLEFSDKAGSMSFNLFSDASWTSSKTANWFEASPSSGFGDALIEVSVEENTSTEERSGTIIYDYGDKSENVNVHQLAKYMTIDNQTFDFDSKGGNHIIELSTNDNWTATVENDDAWVGLSKTSGAGSDEIVITAEDNPSVNARSTTIVINAQYSQSVRILVSQKPRHLSVSCGSISFFANGGTSEVISVETDGIYEINGDTSWFTINKGEGDTFTVYAPENTSDEMRSGKITVALTDLKEGTLSIEIPVVQAGTGGSFIVNGYPADKDWDHVGDGSLSVTVHGYTSDKNWDSTYGGSLTVNVTGYSPDKDWNNSSASTGRRKNSTYTSDNNEHN